MRDARLCDLMINKTHGPVKPGSEGGRQSILTLLDQKSREGNVTLTAKKSKGMQRHRDWFLDGSGWFTCLLIHKSNNGGREKMTFHRDGTNKTPDLYEFPIVSWVKSDNGYEAMRKVNQRAHKMTRTKWSKFCISGVREQKKLS